VADTDNHIELSKRIITVNFKTLFEQYIKLRDTNSDDHCLIQRYELEHPIFKAAYENLGSKVINSCKFNEKTIKDKLFLKSSEVVERIKNITIQKLDINRSYTLSEIKELLVNVHKEFNVHVKPKATDLQVILADSSITPIFTNTYINGKSVKIVKFKS